MNRLIIVTIITLLYVIPVKIAINCDKQITIKITNPQEKEK